MLDYTAVEKAGYNSISYNQQIKEIIDNKNCINKLRSIQKKNLFIIRRKINNKHSLTQEEKDYVFNLYYNFVVNAFTFDTIVTPINIIEETEAKHIGMKMLNNLKLETCKN